MIYAIFGLVLLAFGLVSLLMRDTALVLAQVVPGLGLLIYAGVAHLSEIRERITGEATQRGAWFGSNALLQTLALIGILGFVGYLAHRHPLHWDWTEAGIHTLTEGSRQVLEQIPEDKDVEIYAFYSTPDMVRDILDRYDYASDRISYRILDPNKNPIIATKFEIFSDGVLMVCQGPCEESKATVRNVEPREEKLTEAIRSVISEKRKIYFVTGHDEGDPRNQASDGFSGSAALLDGENIDFDTLLLAQAEKVPDDADAVVIAAPSFSFFERETKALDTYLRQGGRVLLMADALQDAKLADMLREYSIELGDDVIVDEQLQLLSGPQLSLQPVISDYGAHPVTDEMRGQFTLFQLARTVGPAEGATDVTVLLETSRRSWALPSTEVKSNEQITLDPEKARNGPLPLAVAKTFSAAGSDESEGRLIVVGDSDFAANRYYAEAANADLFLNMVNWLVGEESFISIDRKRPRASRVDLAGSRFRTFSYLGVLFLPEGILLLGIWNWWRRRQA